MSEADLFAFEVPSSRGKFRIIGPDTLPPDEAQLVGARIARVLALAVNDPGREPISLTNEYGRVECAACDTSVLPENWANHVRGMTHDRKMATNTRQAWRARQRELATSQ